MRGTVIKGHNIKKVKNRWSIARRNNANYPASPNRRKYQKLNDNLASSLVHLFGST